MVIRGKIIETGWYSGRPSVAGSGLVVADAKSTPLNSSGLYISGLQDRADKGALHMFKKVLK